MPLIHIAGDTGCSRRPVNNIHDVAVWLSTLFVGCRSIVVGSPLLKAANLITEFGGLGIILLTDRLIQCLTECKQGFVTSWGGANLVILICRPLHGVFSHLFQLLTTIKHRQVTEVRPVGLQLDGFHNRPIDSATLGKQFGLDAVVGGP